MDVVKEMMARLNGTWVATAEDEELQRCYKSLFLPTSRCYGFPARIGAAFLRQNIELLNETTLMEGPDTSGLASSRGKR